VAIEYKNLSLKYSITMEGCCGKSFKFVLVTINALILLMGIILLAIGIFAYVDGQDFNRLVDTAMQGINSDFTIGLYGGTAALIIAISCVIVIVSFLGCCGAWKENRFLLFFNYVAILLLFIGVVAGATIAFTTSIDIIHNPMEESLKSYNENPEIKESWDSIQAQLKCCGVDSYKDWANVTLADGGEVPASCCMEQQNVELCEKSPDQFLDGMDGCFTLLKDTLEKNKSSIGIGTASIVVFMFANLLAIFMYVACIQDRRNYQTLA